MRAVSWLLVLVSLLLGSRFSTAGGVKYLPADSSVCEGIANIKSMPMKGEGTDEAYLRIMSAGKRAIPCLIDKITDTAPMVDPRMAPAYRGIVVGDIAVFILARITGRRFSEFLPNEAADAYEVEGIYGYFRYVADPTHRQAIQDRWREWWEEQEADSAGARPSGQGLSN